VEPDDTDDIDDPGDIDDPSAREEREERGAATGSVAEEAALLVDLLSARGWGPASAAGGPAGGSGPTGEPSGGGQRSAGTRAGSGETHECTCGGRTPSACRVCPVCQLIAFVQRVEPDTIERFADVVGFAATALRDLATVQRERRERAPGRGADPSTDAASDASADASSEADGDASTDTSNDTATDTSTPAPTGGAPDDVPPEQKGSPE
jgi:hypothetical protein